MFAEFRKYIPLIIHSEVKNPKIGIVSVNEIRISKDGKVMEVFVSFLGSQTPLDNLKALRKSSGFIRTHLAKRMSVRFVPEIHFVYDDLYDKMDRLEAAIKGWIDPLMIAIINQSIYTFIIESETAWWNDY